jgi:hypothetical protein
VREFCKAHARAFHTMPCTYRPPCVSGLHRRYRRDVRAALDWHVSVMRLIILER